MTLYLALWTLVAFVGGMAAERIYLQLRSRLPSWRLARRISAGTVGPPPVSLPPVISSGPLCSRCGYPPPPVSGGNWRLFRHCETCGHVLLPLEDTV